MKEQLKQYLIDQVPNPKEEEIEEILSMFEPKDYKKGDFFKKPFTTGNHVAFLPKGAVRVIIYKKNGDEITARIRQDNSFFMDPFRLKGTENSPSGIECLEHLTLLIAPIEKIEKLLKINLAFNIVVRKHITEQSLELAENYFLFLGGTAKERYQFILENKPELLNKFPLRYIASMIGITPTQLSRIRSKK